MLYDVNTVIEGSGRVSLFFHPNDESFRVETVMGVESLTLDNIVGWIIRSPISMDGARPETVIGISLKPFSCSVQGEKWLPVEHLPLSFFKQEDVQVWV